LIPGNIDQVRLIKDLNDWGFNDYKIMVVLGFSGGYVSQLKCGHITQMTYQKAARLYNFWYEERAARLQTQTHSTTT
jgi:hypothetical protein